MWAITGPTAPYWHRNAHKEGPDWLHDATRYIESVLTTTDPAKVREYMIRVRDLHTDNIPVIATLARLILSGARTYASAMSPGQAPTPIPTGAGVALSTTNKFILNNKSYLN